MFDAFISQVVNRIKNVDRQKWELHEKWRIINYCLNGGVLQLTTGSDGQLLEVVLDEESEVLPETAEVVDKPAPEAVLS